MGAVAPVTPWFPKDDLLLKNAIEAGGSLESLAKGAVQFSRRFTMKELQDRWHALLYDPIISVEASARMVEFERSQSTLPSKSNKADNLKDTKFGLGKRNAESVRRCYYAMRKRICSEPLNQGDLNFLGGPGDSFFGTGADGPGPQGLLGAPMTSHFGLEDANFDDLHHVFPHVTPNGAGEFPPTVQHNALEDPNPQNIVHENISQMVQSNVALGQNFPATTQTSPSKQVPDHKLFQANGIQANPVCSNKDVMCSGFGANTNFNSTISECDTSYHLQYPHSPPTMPDWKSMEGMAVPEMPGDGCLRGDDIQAGDPFSISGDGIATNRASDYDIHADSELHNRMSSADLKNAASCGDGYFDDLFNFTSEDEMLIIDGGKDGIDMTYYDGLSSLLLNSPDDVNEDKLHDAPAFEEAAASDAYYSVPPASGPQEQTFAVDIDVKNSGDIIYPRNSVSQTSAGVVNPQFPEICDGVICCVLNTEDSDIPCNDDIIFSSKQRQPVVLRITQSEANNLSLSGKNSAGDNGLSSMRKRAGESDPASHSRGLDGGFKCTVDELGVKFDATRGDIPDGPLVSSTGQTRLVVKNEPLEVSLNRQSGNVIEKPGEVADLSHAQIHSGGFSQERQTSSAYQSQDIYDPMTVEPGGEPLFSDPDEQFSESDADVPYFSDIESMILDMDLGPEDQDHFGSTEVAKYQQEDVKRAIIRLEQNAQSYMRRAIASHGAFAILYGRHSKHYIKKPEVLLGRGTDDVPVDIDLGREGRANKISRRQAILKMEKDGTFNLRNLGRCSIYVNSKEIHPGQTLCLLSNCLVEIRGMPFIFETNQVCVKKYLEAAARRSDAKKLDI